MFFGELLRRVNFDLYTLMTHKLYHFLNKGKTYEVPYIQVSLVNNVVKKFVKKNKDMLTKVNFLMWIRYMDVHPYLPPLEYIEKYNKKIDEIYALLINSYFYRRNIYGLIYNK